jgi:hypothetical protein
VTTSSQQPGPGDARQRVQHPLQRLSGYIRSYVVAEGLAVLLIYVALWFWIGLLLDFGVFKAFSLDWVQELSYGFRVFLLVALLAGLIGMVARKVVLRLLREFRSDALALVLERRFPKELGDRLITAVEMADLSRAERYGYSSTMVEQTIRDAAEAVDKLPVRDVFNWSRLRRAGLWVAALTLVVYLLVGGSYLAFAQTGVEDFTVRFNNVASIWFERNILLRDTIWPRRSHLELLNFPESGDLRIGRDAPAPAVRVRALKWVIADKNAPEGWRAMKWTDLNADLYGKELPAVTLPAGWQDWTIDRIELELAKPETQNTMAVEPRLKWQDIFVQLENRGSSPRLARRFRMLELPKIVTVYYRGETVRSEQSLKPQADNEYSGILSDLRETVRFTANGEDYYTPYKQITVVPPPGLAELTRDEEQPAYLYHRAPLGGGQAKLQHQRQIFRNLPMSLSGAASRIDVPLGTNVVLRGRVDKQLRAEGGVRLVAREGSAPITSPVQLKGDNVFEVRFDNVTALLDFQIELTDTDNVSGKRHVLIKPLEDTPPELDVLVEVIRKTNQGYLVTPKARIPFSGKVRDDHGLDRLEYYFTYISLDAQGLALARPIVSVFQFTPPSRALDLLSPGYLAFVGSQVKAATDDVNRVPDKVELATFAKRYKEMGTWDVPLDRFTRRLTMTPLTSPPRDGKWNEETEFPANTLIRDHPLDPEEEGFDVKRLGLLVTDEKQIQPRYRMRLWMVATDNNVETGPSASESKEKFTVLIVSENELLVEIGKEEETLHLKLEEAVTNLRNGRTKLEQIEKEQLPTSKKPAELTPMAVRTEEILEALGKCRDVCNEVLVDYRRILKELQVNDVHPKIIEKVEQKIIEPLDGALNQEFVRTDAALNEFRTALDDLRKTLDEQKIANLTPAQIEQLDKQVKAAKQQLDLLLERLQGVLDNMGDITTLNELIKQLLYIEEQERKTEKKLGTRKVELQEKIFNQALEGTDSTPPDKKPGPEEKKKPAPEVKKP